MNKKNIKIKPIGNLDRANEVYSYIRDLTRGYCNAEKIIFDLEGWEKKALKIKWDDKDKYFVVEFKGKLLMNQFDYLEYNGKNDNKGNGKVNFSKIIPLRIGETSKCDCGNSLRVKDYSVELSDDDIIFKGIYICDKCNEEFHNQVNGLKSTIRNWIFGIEKIEVSINKTENSSKEDALIQNAIMKIKTEIANGKSKRATELIKEILLPIKSHDKYAFESMVYVLNGRQSKLESDLHTGIISNDDYYIKINQINKALLYLIEQVEIITLPNKK